MGKPAITFKLRMKRTVRITSGIISPPTRIQDCPPGLSGGGASFRVPRLRTATHVISTHMSTETAIKTPKTIQASVVMLCEAAPTGLIIDCEPFICSIVNKYAAHMVFTLVDPVPLECA